MTKYYAFFFILLSSYTYGHVCERCNAIDDYVSMNNAWDAEHQYNVDYDSTLYWYLEGRLVAWDELKYIEVE